MTTLPDIVERPLTEERLRQIEKCNAQIPVFKNADCVLVGDIRSLISEVRRLRSAHAGMVEALKKAAEQFRFYERELRKKADATPSHPNADQVYIEYNQKADANERFAEMCDAAVLAHPSPAQEQWRTMESAPRDGTRILLRYRNTVTEGRWVSHDFASYTAWLTHASGYVRPDWPSHWRHLPVPPGDEI